jgi:putative Ca2+/H+ antiporter (TMEM165/GDT1 family)
VTAFWSALAVVFVAELGDKTQLVALGFGARHRLSLVLVGMALAYLSTNLVSVVAGAVLGATLPTGLVGVVGGLLFVGFAAWTLLDIEDAHRDPTGTGDVTDTVATSTSIGDGGRDGATDRPATTVTPARVVASVAGAMFVAELGDKTMLATATLASTRSPVLVWVGATVGIFLAGALGAVAGRVVGARLPARAVRLGAAALFAVFGVALIVTSI